MPDKDYEVRKTIGKGSFGVVDLVYHKPSKTQFVMKRVPFGGVPQKERDSALNEARLLQRLDHPNIVGCKESFVNKKEEFCIVMPYCDGGDLHAKLQQARGRYIKESLTLALQYCHDNKLLHRDLKTQNIFLTSKKYIKLGDFGISRVLSGTMEMAKTCVGTPYYMSPELVQNKPYSYKSDIWALGCVMYELCTLRHAFEAQNITSLVTKILRGTYPAISTRYSAPLRELIGKMLKKDPRQRPSTKDILANPFIEQKIKEMMGPPKAPASKPAKEPKITKPVGPVGKRPSSALERAQQRKAQEEKALREEKEKERKRIDEEQRALEKLEKEKEWRMKQRKEKDRVGEKNFKVQKAAPLYGANAAKGPAKGFKRAPLKAGGNARPVGPKHPAKKAQPSYEDYEGGFDSSDSGPEPEPEPPKQKPLLGHTDLPPARYKEDSPSEEEKYVDDFEDESSSSSDEEVREALHATLTLKDNKKGPSLYEQALAQGEGPPEPQENIDMVPGGLGQRIRYLKETCIEALGEQLFQRAYSLIKETSGQCLTEQEELEQNKVLVQMLGSDRLDIVPTIDQLIFCEENFA